jgi:hypothetical protein
MKLYCLISTLVFCSYISAQPLHKILDSETKKPVSFATVKVLHNPHGVVASERGEFALIFDNADSILFSCVGYHDKILMGSQIGETIFLSAKVKSLAPVVVKSKEIARTFVIGNNYKRSKSDMNWGPGLTGLKEEYAQKFELPDSSRIYRVKTIYIPVEKFVCLGPLLMRIYATDTASGYPGEPLFLKYIDLKRADIKDRRAIVDLHDVNFYLYDSKSFFISIGWPPDAYHNKCVTTIMLSKLSTAKTYSRSLASKNYGWYSFGQFQDLRGVHYEQKTFYSVELEEIKIQ